MTILFSVLLQIVIASCLRKFIGFKTILILSLFNFVRKVNPKQRKKLEYLLLIVVQRMCESLQVIYLGWYRFAGLLVLPF